MKRCNRCWLHKNYVSISQSRYFSFQAAAYGIAGTPLSTTFQSRNRDTFLFKFRQYIELENGSASYRFNLAIEILFFSSGLWPVDYVPRCQVSISQSRYFSFQAPPRRRVVKVRPCFNLAIEILFFSRPAPQVPNSRAEQFQSRNRDTFLFKYPQPLDNAQGSV